MIPLNTDEHRKVRNRRAWVIGVGALLLIFALQLFHVI